MSKESTNVELKDLEVHGGTVITNPEKGLTEIPPKGQLKTVSKIREDDMVIKLAGKGYKKEIEAAAKEAKETKGFEVGD